MATIRRIGDEASLLNRNENGILRENFTNARVMVWSCSAYRSMCDALYEQFQSGASVILYRMGEGYARKLVKGIPRLGSSRDEVIESLEKLASLSGWGMMKIKSTGEKGAECVVEKSAFILRKEGIGPTTCHFLSGVLAGAGSEIFGGEFDSHELNCAAADESASCRFVLRAKS